MMSKILMLFTLLLPTSMVLAQSDVNFSGTLIREPCTLAPEDSDIEVEFGSVVLPDLYNRERAARKIFRIHLVDCDTTLANLATIQFNGEEDLSLPGLLAIGAGSTAQGIAIGIETLNGETVSINQPSKSFTLSEGDSMIYLAAFVQAYESTKVDKTIVVGDFNSIATFEISYQ